MDTTPSTPQRQSDFMVQANGLLVIFLTRFSPVSVFQKMLFFDHLRVMTKGGLSLVESLHVLSRETSNERLKSVIAQLTASVEEGMQLSEAMAKFPRVFPTMYTKMIAAGEVGGNLEHALEQTVTQLKKSYELSSTIRGAMIYPSVIMVAMGTIGILMVTFVFPQLTTLFEDFNTELPITTRAMIALTNLLSQLWIWGLIITIAVSQTVTHVLLMRRAPKYKDAFHRLWLGLPIVGGIVRQINLARFSLTLSSLMKSAIPIVDALDITADTCPNVHYQHALHDTAEVVKKGTPMSASLMHYPDLFPPMVSEMVLVGEQSGDIQSLLTELANFYNDEVTKTMKNFTSIIEPVIILVIGVVVALMAVAVIMPMYTLVQNF